MSEKPDSQSLFQRLDSLNEFERRPISEDRLQSGRYFAGLFAGEHVAATEFVIGALFVNFGASAFDVFVGLAIGNLIAVAFWTFICAPIAVQTRLTLYWYLRDIGGPAFMVIFNILNAVMYCILAGSMITVAASAVRIPFGIPVQSGWLPTDFRFVLVVFGVGTVVVVLAIWGFRKLALFASLCSPWMLLMFVAGAVVSLPVLGEVGSWSDFWRIANERIWTGKTGDGSAALSVYHIIAFAALCNLGMNLGLSDMALFRYAKRSWYGVYSAFGMLLGHYLAWICAGTMGAAAAFALGKGLGELDSGAVAYQTLGLAGAIAVVIAGWTTSNPTLYRVGLALQVITPGWPRWLVTLLAGAVTTTIACSPFVFVKLLDFVGLYGLLLMPVGVIVVMEHWVFPRIGFTQFWSTRRGMLLNTPAFIACVASLGIGITAWRMGWIHLFFLPGPVWFMTAFFYLVLAGLSGARDQLPKADTAAQSSQTNAPPPLEPTKRETPEATPRLLHHAAGMIAIGCLAACLFLPFGVFLQDAKDYPAYVAWYKQVLPWITLVYFVTGLIWIQKRKPG